MKPFNCFPKVEDFTCDKCQGRFYKKPSYSVARNWEEFNHFPTFCFNCMKIIQKQNQPQQLDKRTLNKTGRIHLFATRAKKSWIRKLKSLARKQKIKYVELLERALECYEKHL